MAVKSWNVGDVLSAADMNAWAVPIAVVKPADTGRNTTTTVTNDPDLQISLASSASYQVRVLISYKGTTNGNSDAQFQINVPAGATGFYGAIRYQLTGFPTAAIAQGNLGTSFTAATNGTANVLFAVIEASVTTAGTAGTVALAWAQNTSNGTNTTVIAGSQLIAQRVG